MKKSAKGVIFEVALICALLIAAAFTYGFGVAYASEDTFELIFPKASYFQTKHPALIAANDSYLAVYDDEVGALFVTADVDYYSYPLSLEEVRTLLLVGDKAFIEADGSYYTLDLTDKAASPQSASLPTPANITSLCSDGQYLYARSTGGYLSVYGEDMTIAEQYNIENVYNEEILAGRGVMAAKDGKIYLFTATDENKPLFFIYDCATQAATYKSEDAAELVQAAYIGDIILAQISDIDKYDNGGRIVGLDRSNGEQLFVSPIAPSSFYAYGNKLYAAESDKIIVYTVNSDNSGLVEDHTISMAGGDLHHLNAPLDLVKADGKIAVADSLNDRIAYVTDSELLGEVKLDGSPVALTQDKDGMLYCLLADGRVSLISSDGSVRQIAGATGAKDIVSLNNAFYALCEDGLYSMILGNFHKYADIEGGRRIAANTDGQNLYILTDEAIITVDMSGNIVDRLTSSELSAAKDIAVDYAGDIFVIYAERIVKMHNGLTSLSKVNSTELVNATVKASANSACLDGETLYFSADECLLGKLTVDAATKESFVEDTPSIDKLTPYHFAKLKDGTTSAICPANGRFECAEPASNDVLLVLDTAEPPYEGMTYALDGDKLILVITADYDVLTPATAAPEKGKWCANQGATLYSLPYLDSEGTAVTEYIEFDSATDVAGYDGNGWLIVTYKDAKYFARREDIKSTDARPTMPSDDEKTVKGRAKAKRVGGLVSIYSDSARTSAICDIVDGTLVEILEEHDGFYLVKYDDTIGYMNAVEVQIGGLTTVQIISIVLAVVVLLAGTGIFIAIHTTKQQLENENKDSSD